MTPALKSASGFDASAEENWRTSCSRPAPSSFSTSARMRCCTATLLSSPKWRASSLAIAPSAPKAPSKCCANPSASSLTRAVSATSAAAVDFSRSARKSSTVEPACSRSRTRAPVSITRSSVSTGRSEPATSSTARPSSTIRPSTTSRSLTTATWGGRRAAAASMTYEVARYAPYLTEKPSAPEESASETSTPDTDASGGPERQ